MSKVLFQRQSSLLYSSRPCRCRYFAQSAFAECLATNNEATRVLGNDTVTAKPAAEPGLTPESSPGISDSLKKRSNKFQPKDVDIASSKPLQPTKVDIYLASLHSAGLRPSLADLERYRPPQHGVPGSPQYAKEYKELMDHLSRSFSKDQLRHFGILYELDPVWTRPNRRKAEYAQAIVEKKWLWPCLKEIERKTRDRTEVLTQTFSVTPNQLFLILGKDGSDLLQLSREFNVRVALVQEPLSLRIEGLRGSLKLLAERISNLKKSIIEGTIQLSSPLPQSSVQRISRLSGAFVENLGLQGKVRIFALDSHNHSIAQRLASRAIHHIQEPQRVPLLSYIPTNASASGTVPMSLFRQSYSLYPFLSHRVLPWTISTGGVFRVRRVGEWLSQEPREDINKTGGLAKGKGNIFTLKQDLADLKQTLLGAMPEGSSDTTRTITVTTGHILFSNPGLSQRATLVPPLRGNWPHAGILQWVETKNAQPSFVPSLPVSMLNSSSVRDSILHRLIYHSSSPVNPSGDFATPTKILKLEILLAQPKGPSPSHGPPVDRENISLTSTTESDLSASSNLDLTLGPRCWTGFQAEVRLMMPDRAMDMCFLVEDLTIIPRGSESVELQQYFTALRLFLEQETTMTEQPQPPVTLTYGGDIYELSSSTSVRRSMDEIDSSMSQDTTHILHENVLDLESNEKSVVCQIKCSDPASAEGWAKFMATCDKATAFTRYSVDSIASPDLDSVDL